MFDKLFKSKRQRQLDRELAIQRGLARHRQYVAQLQRHEEQYVEKAGRAVRSGDKLNLQRLYGMILQTKRVRQAVDSQLLYYETVLQTHDRARLNNEFATGLRAMVRSLADLFQEFNASEVLENVEKLQAQISRSESEMDTVVERIRAVDMSSPLAALDMSP